MCARLFFFSVRFTLEHSILISLLYLHGRVSSFCERFFSFLFYYATFNTGTYAFLLLFSFTYLGLNLLLYCSFTSFLLHLSLAFSLSFYFYVFSFYCFTFLWLGFIPSYIFFKPFWYIFCNS